jgi:hypothetical protein
VRQSISSFSKIDEETTSKGLEALAKDLSSGVWEKRNNQILNRPAIDLGYRLITAKVRNSL